MDDRYGSDVLAAGWRERGAKVAVDVPAERDLVVEVAVDGFCGAVTRIESGQVELEDYKGRRRLFPLGAGFMIDGEPVRLVHPSKASGGGSRRTASGSFAVADSRARTALPSRILVEGRHDAELVEKVWGTTCGSKAWSSSTCRGSTCSRNSSPRLRRGAIAGTACSWTTSSRDRRRPGSWSRSCADRTGRTCASSVTPISTCGSASRRRRWASARGRRSRAAPTGRPGSAARSAGPRTRRPTSRTPGSASCPVCRAIATWSRRCWAAWRSSSTS